MKSFRTELENPEVEKDIIDLERKIYAYKNNQLDEEKFRSLRLARGIYGQRQQGVQMIRIKLPYGRLTSKQLTRIADISDEYASSTLHATTRQDIQIHYVSLDRTPELWAKLEEDQITLREACGNTVRNITASPLAGVDPEEPFDVSPYAHAMFEYFLRNPVCQEMGRKFKISFSSNKRDSAISFIHDLGFIPKIKMVNGANTKGFKVMIGGGLGAQPRLAEVAYEFLETNKIIPYTESILRIYDRYGERARRQKARLKFLLSDIGLDELHKLVKKEQRAVQHQTFEIPESPDSTPNLLKKEFYPVFSPDSNQYKNWYKTNVIVQKQKKYRGVYIKLPLGNMSSGTARALAALIPKYALDDIRITANQGYFLRFIQEEALPHLYLDLKSLGLAEPGFDSTADITACPGTDTCNLGISNSTGIARALENVIVNEFPEFIHNQDVKIKISGCPNSCGQHGIAGIGFHGSSLKSGGMVLPALQVLLGGSIQSNGKGQIADKVIKIPSKRGLEALRTLLNDYTRHKLQNEQYSTYYNRQGKMYFYQLLKPLTELDNLSQEDFIDWEQDKKFKVETAVGECAGVIIDLVSTLFLEAEEKIRLSKESFQQDKFSDSIYHAYSAFIQAAKGMLLTKDVTCNTHMQIIERFDEYFTDHRSLGLANSIKDTILLINRSEPNPVFAKQYFTMAYTFLKYLKKTREQNNFQHKSLDNEISKSA
jgi:sulfite reductase (ferredoxin)